MAEADSSNNITRKYIYGKGLLAVATSSERYCYHFNATGSTIALTTRPGRWLTVMPTNPSAPSSASRRRSFSPSSTLGNTASWPSRAAFTTCGQGITIRVSGDSVSEDPLGFGGGDVNLYAYVVSGNPVNWIDPDGLASSGNILGKIWNLPNTVVGIIWGGIGVPFGAKVTIGNNAIQFENHPFMPEGGAITFGNAISYGKQACPTEPLPNGTFGKHEQQHTYQGELLGPLYLPSNILGLSAGEMLNGDTHGEQIGMKVVRSLFPPRPW